MLPDKAKPEKKNIESKDFRTFFVNTFSLSFGDTDVSIIMSAEVPDPHGDVVVQNEARIIMTPRGAKVLSLILNKVISEFEKANGPIPMQPGKEQEIADSLVKKNV